MRMKKKINQNIWGLFKPPLKNNLFFVSFFLEVSLVSGLCFSVSQFSQFLSHFFSVKWETHNIRFPYVNLGQVIYFSLTFSLSHFFLKLGKMRGCGWLFKKVMFQTVKFWTNHHLTTLKSLLECQILFLLSQFLSFFLTFSQ